MRMTSTTTLLGDIYLTSPMVPVIRLVSAAVVVQMRSIASSGMWSAVERGLMLNSRLGGRTRSVRSIEPVPSVDSWKPIEPVTPSEYASLWDCRVLTCGADMRACRNFANGLQPAAFGLGQPVASGYARIMSFITVVKPAAVPERVIVSIVPVAQLIAGW